MKLFESDKTFAFLDINPLVCALAFVTQQHLTDTTSSHTATR